MRNILWIFVGVLWIGVSCGGLAMLAEYANSPGPAPRAPQEWPIDAGIDLSKQGDTLILFAHPRCPCTRASIGELAKIVSRFQGIVTTWVVFFKPSESDESWDQTDLRSSAAAIPGVHVISDQGGVVARRFHATTSGETVLYNDRGELLFCGGITLARGHAGDNAGRSAIEACLRGNLPDVRQTPVFGCLIADSSDSVIASEQ
jgi:hypothetical protein